MSLRIKYLKNIIATDLALPKHQRKLHVDVLKEAALKAFVGNIDAEDDKLMQSLACLDLILTGDEWPTIWADALETTNCSDDLIKIIVSKLKIDEQKMRTTVKVFGGETGEDIREDQEQFETLFYIQLTVISFLVLCFLCLPLSLFSLFSITSIQITHKSVYVTL